MWPKISEFQLACWKLKYNTVIQNLKWCTNLWKCTKSWIFAEKCFYKFQKIMSKVTIHTSHMITVAHRESSGEVTKRGLHMQRKESGILSAYAPSISNRCICSRGEIHWWNHSSRTQVDWKSWDLSIIKIAIGNLHACPLQFSWVVRIWITAVCGTKGASAKISNFR